ncbi:hypothetical protein L207DRAFT_510525 [Hyaloscypha variabilis F]|uniref:Homeobox domain-containing protein n=1 Tax=Hyaloscypha variabilis (strain UAMH 11265 / GT02V1 / F) TaxID=1149755 RepID=A0A2J6RUW5_HYAVF|nr:hypothetical protein L207DRAFT_510525 [Hyaloscypha variabilis F]
MPFPTISCNVVDRRTGLPAVGIRVLLRCVAPHLSNSDFHGKTDKQGYVFEWAGFHVPEISLPHFLFNNNSLEKTTWQMGFMTTEYFQPAEPRYTCADVNFELHQGQRPPHITLYADINGYGTWVEPLKDYLQRPIARTERDYHTLSKDQNKALMEHFVDEPYPDSTTYRRLSEEIDLPREHTIRWFRRQRAQTRRNMKQQKRYMLEEEAALIAALEDGCISENNATTPENAPSVELITTPAAAVAATEQCAGNVMESDNIGTVFVELGGKLVRRSGRQVEKAAK